MVCVAVVVAIEVVVWVVVIAGSVTVSMKTLEWTRVLVVVETLV